MAYVKVDENEPLEKSIKRFKRMVEKEGIIREWNHPQPQEQGSCKKADEEGQEDARIEGLLIR